MPSTIETSSTYQQLLVEGLREVATRNYTEEHERFDARSMFYRDLPSDKAFEEFYSVSGVGDIPKWNGKLEALVGSPGYKRRIEPAEFAAMRQWERKFLDDKQYDVMNDNSADLGIAAARTINKYCGYPFVYATSNSLEFLTYNEENLSLVNSAHTTKSGASTTNGFTNTTTLALSPTNLDTVRLIGANIRSPLAKRINTNFDTLLVPNSRAKLAYEISQTNTGLQSGEGTANYWKGRYNVLGLLGSFLSGIWCLFFTIKCINSPKKTNDT